MIRFLQTVSSAADSLAVAERVEIDWSSVHLDTVIEKLIELCVQAGKSILVAALIYVVGHFLIKLIKRLLSGMLSRRNVEASIRSFLMSTVSVLLNTLLLISVIGALGVNTTSFAALLASAGVAVGMALSGNLQNFAGGLIILFFKPYKLGDWVEAQGVAGTVTAIQLMHTVVTTVDNKVIFVPNGTMSSGVIVNYSAKDTRRVDWKVSVEYGEDMERVKAAVLGIVSKDVRILKTPEPFVALSELSDSSVDISVRVWVKGEDYWDVYFDVNRKIYDEFNRLGIGFPFPQVTVHKA